MLDDTHQNGEALFSCRSVGHIRFRWDGVAINRAEQTRLRGPRCHNLHTKAPLGHTHTHTVLCWEQTEEAG